ncbi:MAG: peptidylprolyl isomerase [Verrucomicrobiota bacterium]|nr:peptidylprolyl isomerase [Verrucomicrobiota bacterium]MED6300542.1 peptidylprolyl isomerase [Verrucomicrobiota bacterium]
MSILYLVGDIYWFGGPLKSRLDQILKGNYVDADGLAIKEEIVATVNAHPIRRQDLERATKEYCRKNGILLSEISRSRINAIRLLVLDQLVVDRLIWFHSYHYPVELSQEEIDEALIRFRRGFKSSEEFEQAALSQGFSVSRIDTFLQNQFMQRAWIEKTIRKHIIVSEEEIIERYESDKVISMIPERVNAKHIFFSTLDKNAEQVEERVQSISRKLKEGQSFETLAMRFSEDSRNKNAGGNLGWITRDRVPNDFYDEVIKISIGKTGTPFKTKLGWHIVNVIDQMNPVKASLDLVHDEIAATIEVEKRQRAIEALINHIKGKAKIRYTGQFTWIE